MKKYLLLLAAAVGIFSACEKNDIKPMDLNEKGAIRVAILGEGQQTKADITAETTETAIAHAQILVFDSSSKLVQYKSVTTSTATIEGVPFGTYTVYAVTGGNGDEYASVSNVSDLTSSTVALTVASAASNMVMVGSGSATVNSSSTAAECPITVTRLVSRIRLVSVADTLTATNGIILKDVQLVNVLNSSTVAGAVGSTYNYLNDAYPAYASLGNTNLANPGKVTYDGTSGNAKKLFYCYANATGEAADQFNGTITSGVARTRIVIKAEFNGTDYYYPVTVPNIERNKCYDVTVTIKGPGSDNPNKKFEKGNISVSITVAPWVSGADIIETF